LNFLKPISVGMQHSLVAVGMEIDGWAALEKLIELRQPVTLVTTLRVYPNMLITSLVAVREAEADRLLRVVGHGETRDLEVAEAEGGAGLEEAPGGLASGAGLHGAGGGGVGEELEVGEFFEAIDARGVVAVLMRNENGG
jgi:hypothetical protein